MKIKELTYDGIANLFSIILDGDTELHNALLTIDGYYDSHMLSDLFFSRSMDKYCSNLIEWIKEEVGETYIIPKVQSVISSFYKRKWLKLIDTYNIEYNAIKPYDMTLHDELLRDNLTSESYRTSDNNATSTDTSSYKGFNSDTDFVDTDKDSSTTATENESSERYERDRESERAITREGNIGNKSIQQLIEEERDLLKWNVYIVILKDFDRVLCARIWDTHIV